jgi:prepilin-type N-terminal cleavage/methylation domain-containing protein
MRMPTFKRVWQGFTLVELLVVISIIALLLAILMPSLNKARNQARLVICQANTKQIATIVEIYRSANDYAVPLVYTSAVDGIAEKMRWISMGLRGYGGQTKTLPASFDINRNWGDYGADRPKVIDYCRKYLEKFWVCPFTSGGKTINAWKQGPPVKIGGVSYNTQILTGYVESYQANLIPLHKTLTYDPPDLAYRTICNYSMRASLGFPHGGLKFGDLIWNTGFTPNGNWQVFPKPWSDAKVVDSSGKMAGNPKNNKWSMDYVRGVGGSGLSDVSSFYCTQGQFDAWSDPKDGGCIMNFGSHARKNVGGTNVAIGDGHVEWVPGTQIGW